jgi:hypothetical protein
MRVRSAAGLKLSPALPPPARTTSAGPSSPKSSCSSARTSSGENVCVVSTDGSPFGSSAPQREQ